jgi:hypothetical protein
LHATLSRKGAMVDEEPNATYHDPTSQYTVSIIQGYMAAGRTGRCRIILDDKQVFSSQRPRP